MLTCGAIQTTLKQYGYSATPEYAEKVRAYVDLLLRWNRRVALTAIVDPGAIVKFHFGESLFGMITAGMKNGRLADVGTGAGFPGAPIAMARPEIQAVLIESNGKRAAFLAELRRELGLQNVDVYHGRAENVRLTEKFQFVTARALGDHAKWLKWALNRLTDEGRVVFWVGTEGSAEIKNVSGWETASPDKIPGTKDRFVLTATRHER